jgi:hypothetical protein
VAHLSTLEVIWTEISAATGIARDVRNSAQEGCVKVHRDFEKLWNV